MTDNTPAAVATGYFDALGRGDLPGALGLLSPDITWHQPGDNRFSGKHHTVDGVKALLGGIFEVSQGTFQLAVTGPAMSNGAQVAVPVRFSAQRQGAELDTTGIDLLTITDGLISEVHLFTADQQAEDAFWGKA